ncbi:transposable element Tcb2 transposase [Trichonephila clavipes]|nr:transposable element Tcb2 transposase [Trichonephila clavipes]
MGESLSRPQSPLIGACNKSESSSPHCSSTSLMRGDNRPAREEGFLRRNCADHSEVSGRKISSSTVRRHLHNSGVYARRPVVCIPLNRRQRRARLSWVGEHVSWTRQRWASVLFTDESRFPLDSDSVRLISWRVRSPRYHQSNIVERHSYRGGGTMVWAGISLGGHTYLHVFQGGTLTDVRYPDEILGLYVCPYVSAIGNDFILMDDCARTHRVAIVEKYLKGHGLERME